jgi:putative membrane protein insertion efficiency factor
VLSLKTSKSSSPHRSGLLSEILSNMSILLIDIYRGFFSSVFAGFGGSRCRFTPTCSCYSRDAFKIYGFRRGLILTFNRIVRCHPWGGYGHDPINRRP